MAGPPGNTSRQSARPAEAAKDGSGSMMTEEERQQGAEVGDGEGVMFDEGRMDYRSAGRVDGRVRDALRHGSRRAPPHL